MLIIYAHPNKDGHCGYTLEKIKNILAEKNINYSILDLYQENYNPILKPTEHYTSGHYEISPETKRYQELLKNENKFIIIYPTWWNNIPAILKGFFDRTLTSRFAFYYEGLIPHGLLEGRALVFTTTGGPSLIEKLFLGNRSLNVVTKDVLRFCGIKSKGVLIGSARKFNEKQKLKIEEAVKRNINFIL
jgi:NAD(P)H dehydrogenase (quinone)